MWRRGAGVMLAISAVLVSPCCLPITIPVALVALGGTGFGVWMATHEAAIAVVGTVYFFAAGALGIWWAMTRSSSPMVRSRLSLIRFRLFHPTGITGSTATEDVAPSCILDGSCAGGCCSPPVRAHPRAPENV